MPSPRFVSLLVLTTLLKGLAAYAASPDARIDVQHYAFRLDINDRDDVIRGEADVVIRFAAAKVQRFSLDLVGLSDDRKLV